MEPEPAQNMDSALKESPPLKPKNQLAMMNEDHDLETSQMNNKPGQPGQLINFFNIIEIIQPISAPFFNTIKKQIIDRIKQI